MPTVYILKCKDNCYYIGKTTGSYFKIIDDHFKGLGCEWTQVHKPIRLEMLRHFCDENDDDFYTRLFITKYGIDKVRGGSYSQLELSEKQISEIRHHPIDTHLICYQCHMKGHKRHLCPFSRNSFEKKDTIEDMDDDKKNNEDITNKSFVKNMINHVFHPVKKLSNRFYNHKLSNVLSLRLGRAGSVHKLFDVKG